MAVEKRNGRPPAIVRKMLPAGQQISDTIGLGLLLALSGGLMDAYSYLCRGEVFANAQTGNMLLLGVHLSQGAWGTAFYYFCPVAAFAGGILVALFIRHWCPEIGKLHWRQLGVLVELLLLAAVAFIPQEANLLANSMISLACGFQVEAFRKIDGNSIATTMCIGNLRSAIHAAAEYSFTGVRRERTKSLTYFLVIFFFVLGAVLGSRAIEAWGEWTILCSSGLLLLCFALMFLELVRKEEGGDGHGAA